MQCPECGKILPTTSALDEHREIVHGLKNTIAAIDSDSSTTINAQSPAVCPDCGQTFDSELLLEWHREAAHRIGADGSPLAPAEANPYRRSTRVAGCVMYSIVFLAIIILGLVFHWQVGWIVASLVGIVVVYIITFALDENEADWKEKTSEEFRRKYQTPPAYLQKPVSQVIPTLTSEQKALIPEFVLKWRRIALETAPAERSKAEQAIGDIYLSLGLKPPKIVWCTSPLANGLTRAIVQRLALPERTNNDVWDEAQNKIITQIGRDFWESVKMSVADSPKNNAGANLASLIHNDFSCLDLFLWDKQYSKENSWDIAGYLVHGAAGDDNWETVRTALYPPSGGFPPLTVSVVSSIANDVKISKSENKKDEARASSTDFAYTGEVHVEDMSTPDMTRYKREKVKVRVKYTVGERAEDSIGNSVRASALNSCYGQDDAAFLVLFDYFRYVCGLVDETDGLRGQWEQAQTAGWYLPHEHTCWVSDRHNILHLNDRNLLHCETGPAIGYPDGWGVYALNGVVMKSEYVLTAADNIEPQVILKERNVEIRRELLRKVGVGRLLRYGKEVDRQDDYRLIDMSPIFKGSGIRYAPFLLIQSASVEGTQYFEGVSPDCRTVEQAINWRASEVAKTWTPDMLS